MSEESDLVIDYQREIQSSPSPMPTQIPKHQALTIYDIDILYSTIFKKKLQPKVKNYDSDEEEDEDFKWFASGEVNLEPFRGKYIAIWKKQIISASDSVEAERVAKDTWGENISPIVTFIPKNELTSL